MINSEAIVLLSSAEKAVAKAKTVQELKTLRNKAEAVRIYAKQANLGLEIENHAAEVRILAECRAGELLAGMEKAKGGRPKKTNDTVSSVSGDGIRLKDLGITPKQSERWRAEASVPEKERQEWIEKTKKNKERITAGGLIRKAKHEKKRKETMREAKLAGKFSVVLADPPWKYGASTVTGAAADHYPTMDTDAISAMPIAEHATKNAVLFLWCTNPLLPDGLRVLEAWGFKYKTNLVWVKDKATSGLGFYVRGQHELLLIGVRGAFEPKIRPTSIIRAPRGKHSQKPEEAYRVIEAMYPDQKSLELFAREKRKGWEAHGNEIDETAFQN